MLQLRVCVDVDDMERAIAFYTRGLGLRMGRRLRDAWCELLGASSPIDLLDKRAGSRPYPNAEVTRDYHRHWTPVHFDLVVTDLEPAVARATEAGAKLESPIADHPWGRIAMLADPFGHGICLIQFKGSGYDELLPM